jgi:hypothetical protein
MTAPTIHATSKITLDQQAAFDQIAHQISGFTAVG